jgi:hypothetical protein
VKAEAIKLPALPIQQAAIEARFSEMAVDFQ